MNTTTPHGYNDSWVGPDAPGSPLPSPEGGKLDGYVPIEAYTNGTNLVVLGRPHSDDKRHNCDAMGCGSVGPHIVHKAAVRIAIASPPPPPANEVAGQASEVDHARELEHLTPFLVADRDTMDAAAAHIRRLEAELAEAKSLAARSTRRLVELAEPGSVGAFAARDAALEREATTKSRVAVLERALKRLDCERKAIIRNDKEAREELTRLHHMIALAAGDIA